MNQPTPGMQVTPSVRLVRCMSGGAMGSVWLAEHTGLETQVVVKFIAQEVASSPEIVQRFAREAAAASRVKSPHVVQMLDHGVTRPDGQPYIIMELLEGRDLQQRIREQRRLPPAEVATIVGQLCKALARAHERGVLHRDIKPSNIFLCDVGGNEIFVKLLDFGVAKTLNGPDLDTTKAGAILGTPFFMSPEQLAAGDVDHRSDLWALGVLSFMLLTGKRPFRGDSISTLTLAVHVTDHPVPSALVPSLPPGFDAWFKRACALDRDKRFQSARELAEALCVALELPSGLNVNATDSYPALNAPPERAPSDAPSVPGLGSSAYNYATAAEIPPRKSRRRAAIMLSVAGLAVILGFVVLRTQTSGPPAPAAAKPPNLEEPAVAKTVAPPPPVVATVSAMASATATEAPASEPAAKPVAVKPTTKVKPKAAPAAKAEDPFGDSRH